MNANLCGSICCVIIVWLPSHLDLFMGHPLPLGLLAGWSKTHYSTLGLGGLSQLPEDGQSSLKSALHEEADFSMFQAPIIDFTVPGNGKRVQMQSFSPNIYTGKHLFISQFCNLRASGEPGTVS